MRFSPKEISDGIVVNYLKQSQIARTAEEAEAVINGFHRNQANLVCNEYTRKYLARLFSGEEVSSEIRTTGCGPHPIRFFLALAPTIEEHEKKYRELCDKRREERRKEAEEHTRLLLAEFNEKRRGWYYVEIEVDAMRITDCKSRHFQFTGEVIADSKMDAYNKAVLPNVSSPSSEIEKMACDKGCILECYSEWNSQLTNVEFLGMRTDEGYSIEAWEEWMKEGGK